MKKEHHYALTTQWTGNTGHGTKTYTSYSRDHKIFVEGKPVVEGSSDPAFRGDASRHNPEELFLAALSGCHMLWYLHLCAEAGVIVIEYTDRAEGFLVESAQGGHFKQVILHPDVVVQDRSMLEKANALHHEASKCCYIASSCNFPVNHEPGSRVI